MEGRRDHPFQTPPPMFPKASRSLKLQDKPNAFKSGKSLKQLSPDQFIVGSKTSGSYNRKHRPYRDGAGVDELVKYMTNVPAYLQLLQRGDSNQEKALNVGVLDWGRLRKWTHNHEPVKSQKGVDSPSPCCTTSSFSTHDLSSPSCEGTNSGNSVTQTNHSPKCGEEDCLQATAGVRSSTQFACFLNLEIASLNTSVAQTNLEKTDAKGHAHSENKLEKNARNFRNIKHACGVYSPPQVNTSSAPRRDCEIPPPSYEQDTCQSTGKLDKSKLKLPNHKEASFTKTPLVADDKLGKCADGQGLQFDDSDEKPRISFESKLSKIKQKEMEQSRFTGPLQELDQFTASSSFVSHSCPLSSDVESCSWPDNNRSSASSTRLAVSDGIGHHLQVDMAGRIQSRGPRGRSDDAVFLHPKSYRSKTPSRYSTNFVKAGAREPSPGRSAISYLNGLITGSSLGEKNSNSNKLKRVTCSDNSDGDETANNRGRKSPLRRMLDPLLKSKASHHQPEHVPESRVNIARRLSFSDKRPQDIVGSMHLPVSTSSSNFDGRKLVPSTWMPIGSKGAAEDEKQCKKSSRSSVLLRLAWKDGQPLYTFSMNSTDILAATRKKNIHCTTDFECTYTFYYVHELKKKNGGWMNQGSKSKKQALASNVVGKMNVSFFQSLKSLGSSTKSCLDLREFVLVGPELRPTTVQPTQSLPDSELAAIVVRSQKELTEDCSGDFIRSPIKTPINMDMEGNNTEKFGNDGSRIAAILPGEVHGLSKAGVPSPLIDRWKSGGFCDCGGWDAGCSLTILTESKCKSFTPSAIQSNHSTNGTQGTELFIQGGAHDTRPVLSLVALNEGLYAVEFDSSIALLQAFAVCIALLHSRQPQDISEALNNVQHPFTETSTKEQQTRTQASASGSYVPHHPPLSPVGRA